MESFTPWSPLFSKVARAIESMLTILFWPKVDERHISTLTSVEWLRQVCYYPSLALSQATFVPKIAPTPYVNAIASAPQNVTRTAPIAPLAPPTFAATQPSSARHKSDAPTTEPTSAFAPTSVTIDSGSAAPTATVVELGSGSGEIFRVEV